ncbi:transposase [Bryobacter aggregatus]|uniref:transposase n=1 Tax=Bryobacter aggregatus TaxID=360054 RepID=UPI0009B5D092
MDESGLTQKPHRCRTWAPRGQTPILFHHFNWKNLSLIAGLSRWNLHFEMFSETIKSPHIVIFLGKLLRVIPGKILIVWDGLAAHRSKFVQDFIASCDGRIQTLRLPAYAPELNPVEYIWAHLKQHELPNICAKDLWQLGEMARTKLKRMRRRKHLLVACWKQSSLCF